MNSGCAPYALTQAVIILHMRSSSAALARAREQATSTLTLPKSAQALIDRYRHLRIQGVTILCPYHINCGLVTKNRALVGKGRPEEIEAAAEHYFDRYQMHAQGDLEQLRLYLQACGFGVDCSGFAAWVLNCLTQEQLQKFIWQVLSFPGMKRQLVSKLRPLENISANLLTGPRNAHAVEDLRTAHPGDLIRLIHGGHVMVISEVGLDTSGHATYIEYVQSTTSYGDRQGIDTGYIVVTQPGKNLQAQIWTDPAMPGALEESGDDARLVRLKALAGVPAP